jgi:SAM-dependent methyltransferase
MEETAVVDLKTLSPGELARHFRKPDGDVGIAVAEYMNRLNQSATKAAYRRLELSDAHHVLEIGFGNGGLVPLLLSMAQDIRYSGADISPTMVGEALVANRALTESGRADFRLASVEALPFSDAEFDRVVGINTLYFWPDPQQAFAEIRRVLKPNGSVLLACITPETAATVATMKKEFDVNIYSETEIIQFHRDAGFSTVGVEIYTEVAHRFDGTPFTRSYFFSVARC